MGSATGAAELEKYKMNGIETIAVAEKLNRAGYVVLSSTAATVTVADPVQCSHGGGARWTEQKPVVLHTSAQARRFISDRE